MGYKAPLILLALRHGASRAPSKLRAQHEFCKSLTRVLYSYPLERICELGRPEPLKRVAANRPAAARPPAAAVCVPRPNGSR